MSLSDATQNPRTYVGTKWKLFRTLLFDPETFYEDHAGSRGLRNEIVLVFVVGALGLIGSYYAVRTLLDAFEDPGTSSLGPDVEMQLLGYAIEPLVGAFVLWLGFAVALYVASWYYSDAGRLYTLLKNTAWAMVPIAFANVLRSAALIVTAYGLDVETDVPRGFTETIVAYVWTQVGQEPLVIAATAIGAVFVVWTGYIAAHGVAVVRDLEIGEAYRVAAVPTVGYVLYIGYEVVGAL